MTSKTEAALEALKQIEDAAKEVHRLGAKPGPQWIRLSGALYLFGMIRTALSGGGEPFGYAVQTIGNEYSLIRGKAVENYRAAGARMIPLYTSPEVGQGAPAIPDGWQLVPKEPTWGLDAMSGAGAECIPTDIGQGAAGDMACRVYRAMLATSPLPTQLSDNAGSQSETVKEQGQSDDNLSLALLQARYVLRNLHAEHDNCGYGKLAQACEQAAAALSGGATPALRIRKSGDPTSEGMTCRQYQKGDTIITAELLDEVFAGICVVNDASPEVGQGGQTSDDFGQLKIPGGWQLVPKEPTDEMMDAWDDVEPAKDELPSQTMLRIWSAMLAASPLPPQLSDNAGSQSETVKERGQAPTAVSGGEEVAKPVYRAIEKSGDFVEGKLATLKAVAEKRAHQPQPVSEAQPVAWLLTWYDGHTEVREYAPPYAHISQVPAPTVTPLYALAPTVSGTQGGMEWRDNGGIRLTINGVGIGRVYTDPKGWLWELGDGWDGKDGHGETKEECKAALETAARQWLGLSGLVRDADRNTDSAASRGLSNGEVSK